MEPGIIESASRRLTFIIGGGNGQTLEETLEVIAEDIGLHNIAYVRFVSYSDPRIIETVVTYSHQWQDRYSEAQYLLIDPVIAHGCQAVLPFDWEEVRTDRHSNVAFFADAIGYNVGRNGMSIPVRNRSGGFALVSFTSNHSAERWIEYKARNIASLNVMATLIDSAARFTRKFPQNYTNISEMEKRCLTWYARGKSKDEIAEALCLTLIEVAVYFDTIRHKLNCANLEQAVSLAIAREVISKV